jgi:hypothetical protein
MPLTDRSDKSVRWQKFTQHSSGSLVVAFLFFFFFFSFASKVQSLLLSVSALYYSDPAVLEFLPLSS